MSKLSEKELLERLREWWIAWVANIENDKLGEPFVKKDEQAYQQIKERIQKPEVTEEWYKEKAMEFLVKTNISVQTPEAVKQQLKIIQNFIRPLVEEK